MESLEVQILLLKTIQTVREAIEQNDTDSLMELEKEFNDNIELLKEEKKNHKPASITKDDLFALQERTGEGMYTCKNYLLRAKGDVELAARLMGK